MMTLSAPGRMMGIVVRRCPAAVRRHPTAANPQKFAFSAAVDETFAASRWSESPGFLGEYVPQDNGGIKVVIVDPRKDREAWDEYQTRLGIEYSRHGASAAAKNPGGHADCGDGNPPRTLLALAACLETDEMIGGVRTEGPFDDPGETFSFRAIEDTDGARTALERVRAVLSLHGGVLVDGRGNWAARRGISRGLARAMCHLSWFAGGAHVLGLAAEHTVDLYRRVGYDGSCFDALCPDGMPVFHYPNDNYNSRHIMMTPDYLDRVDPSTRHMLLCEQRVLSHARECYRNQLDADNGANHGNRDSLEAWIPEILLDNDPRLRELRVDTPIAPVDHLPARFQDLPRGSPPHVPTEVLLRKPQRKATACP